MSVKDMARFIGTDTRDKDNIKTQFSSPDVSAYFKFLTDEITGADRTVRISERNISGSTLIWGHPDYGTWGTANWGVITNSFSTSRVVSANRTFMDNFQSNDFFDTSSTATFSTGSISFIGTQVATSTAIYKNQETIISATMNVTSSGSLAYELSADGGSNWESVTSGQLHNFSNTGQELKWRASSSANTTLDNVKVTY